MARLFFCVHVTTDLTVRFSGSRKDKKLFFSSSKRPERSWGPPSLLFIGDRISLPGLKRPGIEVGHLPSGAEVNNELSCTSSSSKYLHGMDRKTFIFT